MITRLKALNTCTVRNRCPDRLPWIGSLGSSILSCINLNDALEVNLGRFPDISCQN